REERDRLIAPYIAQTWRSRLLVEGEHRQELDRRYAELRQIRNSLDHPSVGPPLPFRDARARMAREVTDMHLVEDTLVIRRTRWPVAGPIISTAVRHHATISCRRVVTRHAGSEPAAARRHGDTPRVGVQEQLLAIEPQPYGWSERAPRAITINLPGGELRNKGMPVMPGPLGARIERDDAPRPLVLDIIEQQQLDQGGILREDTEIDSAVDDLCAERKAPSRPGFHRIRRPTLRLRPLACRRLKVHPGWAGKGAPVVWPAALVAPAAPALVEQAGNLGF